MRLLHWLRGQSQQDIEEKVAGVQAEEMLETWKFLKMRAENGEIEDNKVNDELFVQFGIDVADIFEAFKFYGLKLTITDADRKMFKEAAIANMTMSDAEGKNKTQ